MGGWAGQELHDEEDEPVATEPFSFEHELDDLPQDQLKGMSALLSLALSLSHSQPTPGGRGWVRSPASRCCVRANFLTFAYDVRLFLPAELIFNEIVSFKRPGAA